MIQLDRLFLDLTCEFGGKLRDKSFAGERADAADADFHWFGTPFIPSLIGPTGLSRPGFPAAGGERTREDAVLEGQPRLGSTP